MQIDKVTFKGFSADTAICTLVIFGGLVKSFVKVSGRKDSLDVNLLSNQAFQDILHQVQVVGFEYHTEHRCTRSHRLRENVFECSHSCSCQTAFTSHSILLISTSKSA